MPDERSNGMDVMMMEAVMECRDCQSIIAEYMLTCPICGSDTSGYGVKSIGDAKSIKEFKKIIHFNRFEILKRGGEETGVLLDFAIFAAIKCGQLNSDSDLHELFNELFTE